jgi:hypothetical protein
MTTLNFSHKTNFVAGFPKFPGLEFYIQDVTLPGITMELQKASIQGLDGFLASSTRQLSDVSFNVLIDEDYEVYRMFYEDVLKSKAMVNATYAQREFDFYVSVYNNKGNLIFTEYFRNCLIESLGDVSLSSTDSSIVNTFSVSLKFDWVDIIFKDKNED